MPSRRKKTAEHRIHMTFFVNERLKKQVDECKKLDGECTSVVFRRMIPVYLRMRLRQERARRESGVIPEEEYLV